MIKSSPYEVQRNTGHRSHENLDSASSIQITGCVVFAKASTQPIGYGLRSQTNWFVKTAPRRTLSPVSGTNRATNLILVWP
jgi:hypothetical protein